MIDYNEIIVFRQFDIYALEGTHLNRVRVRRGNYISPWLLNKFVVGLSYCNEKEFKNRIDKLCKKVKKDF